MVNTLAEADQLLVRDRSVSFELHWGHRLQELPPASGKLLLIDHARRCHPPREFPTAGVVRTGQESKVKWLMSRGGTRVRIAAIM
eukprot:4960364-Pyramimonas_sp.AAC.1